MDVSHHEIKIDLRRTAVVNKNDLSMHYIWKSQVPGNF